MEEIWKDVVGYEGLYQVSNLGRVRSLNFYRKKRIGVLRQKKLNTGYMALDLYKDRMPRTLNVHRLVAIAFVENKDGLPWVNHIDGNKQNNAASNLEWCTAKQNTEHAKRTGLRKQSNVAGMYGIHKKTQKAVNQFTKDGEFVARWDSMLAAARSFHCTQRCISACASGRTKSSMGFVWRFTDG